MTRSTILTIAMLIAIGSLPIAWNLKRLNMTQSNLQAARMALQLTLDDAQEVNRLRSRQERIAVKQRPTQDVIALVNAALAEVGIPSQRLKSLTPESDAAIGQSSGGAGGGTGPLYKRQSLRLTLESLNLQELGAFLVQWRQSQQIWTVSRIELTHIRGSNDPQNNHYDASLLISAVYLDQA